MSGTDTEHLDLPQTPSQIQPIIPIPDPVVSQESMPDHDVDNDITASRDTQISPPPMANIQNNQVPQQATKMPRALKRLLPHNAEGLTEGMIPLEDGGRRSRRRHVESNGD